MTSGGASIGAIVGWLVGGGKMTVLEGLLIGIITLLIGWIATPFGKPIRKAVEDWLYKPDSHNLSKSPLKIEFDQIEPVRALMESHPALGSDRVQRRFYGVCIYNSGPTEMENVSVEVEKIEQMPKQPLEVIDMPRILALRLKFKNGATSMTFPSQLRERVPVISHANGMLIGDQLRMESTQGFSFRHESRRHRLHLKVTASKVPAVTEVFSVWIDDAGRLQMGRG